MTSAPEPSDDSELTQQLIARVVDGESIDWAALAFSSVPADVRERLRLVQVLDEMSALIANADDAGVDADAAVEDDDALETWGRYRLDEPIGEGAFGRVYRGWDPHLQIPVAIKILHRRYADEVLQEELLREARALAQIRHPNVVRVLGVEIHEGRFGLCMEFVQGETLEAFVDREGLRSEGDVTAMAKDLCSGLDAVHASQFVHRDIKARNVMREPSGRVVLMDLGARSSLVHGAEQDTRKVGTPYYMAPELFRGEPASTASDVYALGVLFVFLLTKRYPVEAATYEGLEQAHAEGRRELLGDLRADLPVKFARTIDRALAAEPAARYQGAGEFLLALERLVKPSPLPARIARGLIAIMAVVAAMAGMGLLSSAAFNRTLERSDFASESLLDWLAVGLQGSVLPTVFFAIALLSLGAASSLRSWAVARPGPAALDTRLYGVLARVGLANPHNLARLNLLFSAAAIAFIWWLHAPLLDAVQSFASTAPAARLAALAPPSETHTTYMDFRELLTRLIIVAAGVWYLVAQRCAVRGTTLTTATKCAAVATMLLLVGTLQLPYKLVNRSQFPVYEWRGQTCYATGERSSELLLFCPGLTEGRNRVVQRSDTQLRRTDRQNESVFTVFAPSLTP